MLEDADGKPISVALPQPIVASTESSSGSVATNDQTSVDVEVMNYVFSFFLFFLLLFIQTKNYNNTKAMLRKDVAAWLARADAASLLALAREQPAAFARLANCSALVNGGAADDNDDENQQHQHNKQHLCCALTSLLGQQHSKQNHK